MFRRHRIRTVANGTGAANAGAKGSNPVRRSRRRRNPETDDPAEQAAFRKDLVDTLADREKTRAYLKRVSMIASLERAAG